MILRSCAALAAGLGVALAFEPVAVFWLAPIGVAVFLLTLRGLRVRSAAVPGLCFGAGFQFLSLWWMQAVGTDAWLALACLEASFYALLGAALAVLTRLPAWPLWAALAWVAIEVWRGGWPFGGMPFGRLGFATADTPLADALPWIGTNGVSLLVALLGSSLAWLLATARTTRPRRFRWSTAAAVAGGMVAVVIVPTLTAYPFERDRSVRLAVVQGDVPGDGTDILLDHRQVTANHVQATIDLADEVAAGRAARPDLVIWPENSTAVDPFRDAAVGEGIAEAARAIGVPVLVGAMVDGPTEGTVLNQGIVFDPDGRPGERYAKRHPVPFGEFIPFRDSVFTRPFGKLRLIPRDMVPGDRTTPLPVGGVEVIDALCFDIAYDDVLYDQTRAGGELVVVQTSNAMFIKTAQVDQQFAITRVRALETGRYAVVAATNGVSGVIAPDGKVLDRAPLRTTTVLTPTVGLATAITPATRIGPWVGWVAVAGTLLGLALGVLPYRRQRRAAAAAKGVRRAEDRGLVAAGSEGSGPQ